ncbi:unnamed protein product [Lupinus luteus]|uniref:Phytocyanin domain-containing protein n=1 Tax=Lupinus luteus TaxID=3873 RepID=A0AAV1X3X1_LUPLU
MGLARYNSAMIVIMLSFCMLVFNSEIAHAETYIVGDAAGWDNNKDVSSWSNGKQFKPGDKFVFKYKAEKHNVVKVPEIGYIACVNPIGNKDTPLLNSGNDVIILRNPGKHYFISSRYDDCQRQGMKIILNIL